MTQVTVTFEVVERPALIYPPLVEALVESARSGQALRISLQDGMKAGSFRSWIHQQARRCKLSGHVAVQDETHIIAWFEKQPGGRKPRAKQRSPVSPLRPHDGQGRPQLTEGPASGGGA